MTTAAPRRRGGGVRHCPMPAHTIGYGQKRTERTLTEKAIAWRTLHRYRLIPVKGLFRFCPPGPFVSVSGMYAPARAAVDDSGSPLPHAGNSWKFIVLSDPDGCATP